jgi:hypothetical protein
LKIKTRKRTMNVENDEKPRIHPLRVVQDLGKSLLVHISSGNHTNMRQQKHVVGRDGPKYPG